MPDEQNADPVDELRFSVRVRRLRRHYRLTAEQLAKATGMGAEALTRLERGARRVTLQDAVLIAQAFKLTVDQIAGEAPLVVKKETLID